MEVQLSCRNHRNTEDAVPGVRSAGAAMDVDRFDHLARLFALPESPTRRALSTTIAVALAGVLGTHPQERADARNRGKPRKRRKGREQQAVSEAKKRNKVTVCHQGQTITVPSKKKKVHLRHGDTPGPCPVPTTSPPTTRPPDDCIPACGDKTCGGNGCGGSCPPGCVGNDVCLDGQCVCQPQCSNRECGDDGCGATCGICNPGEACSANGRCNCVPDCDDRVCGGDGCGGSCPPGCASDEICDDGACVCRPDCAGRVCGDDGCGGACGACAANEECTASGHCRCVPDCVGKACGPNGCGGNCGNCLNNHDCLDGQCVCSVPTTLCGDICVYVQSDWANCGTCGNACEVANGSGYCNQGVCAVSDCYGPWRDCDGVFATGCETDTLTSAEHCGSCDDRCSGANATGICVDGACGLICDDGFAQCDINPQNGCETDIRTNMNHCGGCNQKCTIPNATAACVEGACQLDSCTQRHETRSAFSWGDCDGDPANGCEVDIMNSNAHCGACNHSCPDGQVCFDGVCELPCGAGGPCRVFRTFEGFNGNMGGLSGADELCQQQAAAWHFPGTYMAWLSNETESPATRFLLKSPGPYWTAGRLLIANSWADLTSNDLDHAIGSALYPFERCFPIEPAWSNTRADGTSRGAAGRHCQNWSSIGSSASDDGGTGQCGATTSVWTEGGSMTCLLHGRLICFQQS